MTATFYPDEREVETTYGPMKIACQRPPVYDEAHKRFEIDDRRTFYTYGDTLYNPAGIYVPEDLIEHESVHMRQQREIGVEEWWRRYFDEPEFRLSQELEAYGRQYWALCKKHKDRNVQVKFLNEIVQILTSQMYQVDIGPDKARESIRAWAKSHG